MKEKILKHKKFINVFIISLFLLSTLSGCGNQSVSQLPSSTSGTDSSNHTSTQTNETVVPENQILLNEDTASGLFKESAGSRDNTPFCLIPEAPGTNVLKNDLVTVDISNSSEGYVVVDYRGSSKKVKLQITGPDQVVYTYNLQYGSDVFPLSASGGNYLFAVFENIEGNQYSPVFSKTSELTVTNEFGAFLYPNQYVNFHADNEAIALAEELSYTADNDLDVVSNIYNYIIKTITYDYDKAETVQSGYIPDIDEILSIETGICLDYAAVMTSMLRSQRIPTRLEVGYAGEAYHAWISTYITDIGWVNGIIEFNGTEWELMDPTFAANSSEKALKNFIGDGSNYLIKYIY